jgi:hypothetical protein
MGMPSGMRDARISRRTPEDVMANRRATLDVVPEGRGWAVRQPGQQQPQSRHLFLEAAERAAKRLLSAQGGGQVRICDCDGAIRTAETVAPA